MVIPSTISYFMSIFKEAVEDRIEDSRGRLVRLIKCTYFESKGTHKAAVQKPTHLGYQMEMWYGDPHRIYASYKKEFLAFLNKCNGLAAATKWNAMSSMLVWNVVADMWNRKALMLWEIQKGDLSLKDFKSFFDNDTLLVNNPILSREATTEYVGTQGKS